MKSILTALLVAIGTAQVIPYDEKTGLKAMYYAGATYCQLSDLQLWDCGEPCQAGVTSFTPIENSLLNTFGYTAYNSHDNEIVVAFRGTQIGTILNWISDLDYTLSPFAGEDGALVHNGFYQTYQFVSAQVLSSVSALLKEHPSASILVTGHSLGAALATHAAVDIKRSLNPTQKVTFYSYGSPRVGN